MQRFRVIEGGSRPKQHRRAAGRDEELLTCPCCNGSVFIPAKAGMRHDGKTVKGGHKTLLCAQCLAEGRVQLLT